MKKLFFIISAFIIYSPVFALCPINTNGESICSMQNFRDNSSPIFQNKSMNPITNPNTQNPSVQLQPYVNNQALEQTRFQEINRNPNLNCQFGLCPQNNDNQVQQK